MRRARSLIVLAGLALVVGALWWWDQRRTLIDEHQLVPGFDRARIDAITVVRDGQTTRLSKEGADWKVGGLRADADAVDQLLGAIEFGSIERRVGKADDALARQHGLEPARLTVELGGHKLALGNDSPGGRGLYVRRGRQIFVIDQRVKEVADLPPEKWQLRRLLLTDTGAIHSLAFRNLELKREGDRWTVNGAAADARAVDQLLDALDRARATKVTARKPGDGEPLTINGAVEARLGGHHDGGPIFVRADGAELWLDGAALLPLYQTPQQLREPRLFPVALNEITGVELLQADRRLSLQREGGVWRIVAPLEHAGPADDPSVRAWLKQEILPLRSGQDHGPQRLTVRTASSTVTHAVSGLSLDALRFHDRRVIDLRPDDIDRLVVEQGGAKHTVVREHHGGAADTFRVEPPAAADPAALAQLIDTFAQLRAESFFEPRSAQTAPDRVLRARDHEVALTGCDARADGKLWFHLDPRSCRALVVAF